MPFEFSVASLKDKASHAKNASVSKYQDTRDRFSSTPASNFSSDGRTYRPSPPPPPPPSRSAASSNSVINASPASAHPPPPILRSTKPLSSQSSLHSSSSFSRKETGDRIDWANLSEADKQAFFSWLDEFFARHFGIPVKPRSVSDTGKHVSVAGQVPVQSFSRAPPPAATRSTSSNLPSPARGPPPPIAKWSRPTETSQPHDVLTMSYPPPTTHGSAALDLAHYFQPDVPWTDTWYASDNKPLPPTLEGNTNFTWAASFSWSGTSKTMTAGVLFSDLSACWFNVHFTTTNPNPSTARRHAEYLPRPGPLSQDMLVAAHELYGETIAAFAEGFDGTGQFCARGECWDLANEALKHFAQYDYVPKPVPSISRTHGHLIFEGRAEGKGRQMGRWRGGDDRVRRGDIVEWRKVRINIVGAPRGSYATLGDPEHTAIIVSDAVPTRQPRDGENLLPSELVQLEVVEQSVHSPPDRKTYDMAAFEQGEVWIYRPIQMETYLGMIFEAKPPDGVRTLTV